MHFYLHGSVRIKHRDTEMNFLRHVSSTQRQSMNIDAANSIMIIMHMPLIMSERFFFLSV